MAILSNEDVKRELGKNILIHPFSLDNLKGVSINLTASKLGWALNTKKSIYSQEQNALIIPPKDTALIETEETIYVNQNIGGTYHSKVALVSQGIGHIGTTLDPDWIGPSLIALHNQSDSEVKIDVGKSFVSIVLHYLKTRSSSQNTNYPGRPELLSEFNLTSAEKDWLDEDWRGNKEKLNDKMSSNEDFVKVKNEKSNKYQWARGGVAINFYIFATCFIFFLVIKMNMVNWNLEFKDFLVPILAVYLGATAGQLVQNLK